MGEITNYSVTNSTGATQRFSANQKTSLEQKNQRSFISDQSQMRKTKEKRWVVLVEFVTL